MLESGGLKPHKKILKLGETMNLYELMWESLFEVLVYIVEFATKQSLMAAEALDSQTLQIHRTIHPSIHP